MDLSSFLLLADPFSLPPDPRKITEDSSSRRTGVSFRIGLEGDSFLFTVMIPAAGALREAKLLLFRLLRRNISFWLDREARIRILPSVEEKPEGEGVLLCIPGLEEPLRVFIPDGLKKILLRSFTGRKDLLPAAEADLLILQRLRGRIRSLDLPLLYLFERMENRAIQSLLNGLLKEKKVEETMLAGFLQHHPELKPLMLGSLSRNLRADIESLGHFDPLWAAQTDLLFRNALAFLWREGEVESGVFSSLTILLDKLERTLMAGSLEKESFTILLAGLSGGLLSRLALEVPSMTLARAVAGLGPEIRESLLSVMESDKKRLVFREDCDAVIQLPSGGPSFWRALVLRKVSQWIVQGELAGYSRERVADLFSGNLQGLERREGMLLVNEIGIIRFSKALIGLDREVKKGFLARSGTVLGSLFRDVASGKIRYKGAVSVKETEEVRLEALQTLYVWKRTGLAG